MYSSLYIYLYIYIYIYTYMHGTLNYRERNPSWRSPMLSMRSAQELHVDANK